MNLPELPKPVQHEMEHGVCVGYMSVGQCIEYGQACFEQGVSSVHTQEPVAWLVSSAYWDAPIVKINKPTTSLANESVQPLYTAPQQDLMAAAKLALDTLHAYEASIKQFGLLFGNGTRAIEALKKAGVK